MVRVVIPTGFGGIPLDYVGSTFVPEIFNAAAAFSNSVYLHSKLSLREAEGARMRTALINGCTICQNFRVARDLPNASIASRGHPIPNEAFYASVAAWRDSPL